MNIPALFTLFRDGVPMAGNAEYSEGRLRVLSPLTPLKPLGAEFGDRGPAVVIDVKGLNGRVFDDRIVKNAKVSGMDMWLMTRIKDVDDVLDGFMGNAEKLLIPYHTLKHTGDLRDVIDISDCCMPTIFSDNGQAKCFKGSAEIGRVLKEMESVRFPRAVVFDADNSISPDDWSHIYERHPGTIPFLGSCRNADALKSIGFEDVIAAPCL